MSKLQTMEHRPVRVRSNASASQYLRADRSSRWPTIAVGALALLTALHRTPFRLGPNLLAADILALCLVLVSLPSALALAQRNAAAMTVLAGCWLTCIGYFIGLRWGGLGVAPLANLIRDTVPPIFALCVTSFSLTRAVDVHRVLRVFVAVGVLVSILLLLDSGVRSEATFENPSYAASYLLSAAVAVIALQPPPLLRVALLVFFAYAFLTTGSFGIAVAAGAAIFVRVVQRTGSVDPRVRFVTRIGLGLLVVTFAVYVMRSVSVSDLDIGRGFSGERFERSGDSRSELWLRAVTAWSDYPTGVGFSDNPGGTPLFSTSGAREPHSDVLSALLNGGPLAVIGMFVSLLGFYRLLSPGGLGRVLLATMVVGGVFRQTWNFRHLWLLLGVLAASELLARLRRTSSEAHDNAPPSGSRD